MDGDNELQSTIVQTAAAIRSEVTNRDKALSSKIEQTASSIRSEVSDADRELQSQITQNAGNITLKVSKNNVVSEINQSPESIKIKADKVDVSGLVTFSDLSQAGKTTVNGSNITTGTIDASKVTVTNLDAGKITAGSISGNRISGGTIQGVTLNSVSGYYYTKITDGYLAIGSGGTEYARFTYDGSEFPACEIKASRGLKIRSSYGIGLSINNNRSISLNFPTAINSNFVVNGNFSATGSKNSIQPTEHYGDRLLNAYETAQVYFGDMGEAWLSQEGECRIELDPIFRECVSPGSGYHVFLSQYGPGECYVALRATGYFLVRGEPGLCFSWEVKALRRSYETVRLEEAKECNC